MLLETVECGTNRFAAGELWQEHGLMFCREDGTPLDRCHVRKEFQKITRAARLGGAWTPRELRHSFVSILSAHDVRLEDISDRSRWWPWQSSPRSSPTSAHTNWSVRTGRPA